MGFIAFLCSQEGHIAKKAMKSIIAFGTCSDTLSFGGVVATGRGDRLGHSDGYRTVFTMQAGFGTATGFSKVVVAAAWCQLKDTA